MASDQVELVREALDAYRAGGIEALLEYTAPDIEWHTGGTFVDEGTCRGHDEVRRYLGAMEDAFEGLRVDPLELIDAGDAVVGHTRDTARGRGSGVPVEVDHYYAIWFRGDKIRRIQNFRDRAAAFEAVGLARSSGKQEVG
jgi:ketosteroid isomerase-like protein